MNTRHPSAIWFGRFLLSFAAVFLAAVTIADTAPKLLVENSSGAVKLRIQDQWLSPSDGMTVHLPATVSTGDDGSLVLRQGETRISVASNTALEFFTGPDAASILQRVVQEKGSAFYDVAPRESNKLRVETPYLVAVIKGTEFDVTVANEATTISLFEGHLQIEAEDIDEVIQLYEGQIATRGRYDTRITVIDMDDGEPVAQTDARTSTSDGDERDGNAGGASGAGSKGNPDGIKLGDGTGAGLGLSGDLGNGTIGVNLDTGHASLGVDLDVGKLSLDVGVNAGDVALDVGVNAGNLSLDAGLDAGDVSLDVGVNAGDLTLDTGLDVGDVSLETGLDAGDLSLDTSLDAGDISLDTGLDAGDLSLDTGVDAGDLSLDAGLDTGTIDVGVDVGDTIVDVDINDAVVEVELDLEIDAIPEVEVDIPVVVVEDAVPDLGGLLGL